MNAWVRTGVELPPLGVGRLSVGCIVKCPCAGVCCLGKWIKGLAHAERQAVYSAVFCRCMEMKTQQNFCRNSQLETKQNAFCQFSDLIVRRLANIWLLSLLVTLRPRLGAIHRVLSETVLLKINSVVRWKELKKASSYQEPDLLSALLSD